MNEEGDIIEEEKVVRGLARSNMKNTGGNTRGQRWKVARRGGSEEEEREEARGNNVKKKLLRLLFKVEIIAVLFVVIFGFIVGVRTMPGVAMRPNITEGELLIFSRIEGAYKRGDVVVFRKDGKDLVQRVVAEAGQTVDINEEGECLIDGNVEEDAVFYETEKDEKAKIEYPYTVGEGKVFVLNDARASLGDSRSFGAIEINTITGKVIGEIQ